VYACYTDVYKSPTHPDEIRCIFREAVQGIPNDSIDRRMPSELRNFGDESVIEYVFRDPCRYMQRSRQYLALRRMDQADVETVLASAKLSIGVCSIAKGF
jgi:hypothetical protein